jgi:hypothetical protein
MFDGKRVAKDTASFQLCDIVDPMLRDMIEDDTDLREACDVRVLVPLASPSSIADDPTGARWVV